MTRSSVLSNDELRALVEGGWTYASIAGMTGRTYSTIRKRCEMLGIGTDRAIKTKRRSEDDGTAGMAALTAHADKVMLGMSGRFDDDPHAARRTHGPLPARALTNSYAGCATLAFCEAW